MPETRWFRINFEPLGRRVDLQPGGSLMDAAQQGGVELEAICGGVGACLGCRVRLVEGRLSPRTLDEEAALDENELVQGYRLACQAIPQSDCKIEVPPESLAAPQRIQLEGQEASLELDPTVFPLDLTINPPTLEDLRGDDARIAAAVVTAGLPAPLLPLPVEAGMSEKLRDWSWHTRLALHGERLPEAGPARVSGLLPAGTRLLGLAVDVGTTKLAAYLLDLEDGRILARLGAMNPQISYGEDVVSRIHYANQHPDGRAVLQQALMKVLNQLVADLCAQASSRPEQVVEAVLVGNTAMHHLLAGLPVHQLGLAPYVPAVSQALEIPAAEIGLQIAAGALVYLPPNIAGYVGADHIAMLLGTGMDSASRSTLALDIGTNTEISLAYQGRLLSCSCASGPAFEGAHIQAGMRAAAGAVERVQFAEDTLRMYTIGGSAPVGLCGSGILDAVSGLLSVGLLDERGNFAPQNQGYQDRLVIDGKRREFILARAGQTGNGRDLVITRQDINEIQLAKGAIRSGIELLLQEAGVEAEDVEDWIIAGAFGTYLDLNSAIGIGMFPRLPVQRYRQVGNAAGAGARQMLVSRKRRRTAEALAQRVEYVELTAHQDFQDWFLRGILFDRPEDRKPNP